MNIFDFALQIEKENEAFYRKLAAATGSSGLKTIFNWLAAEEAVHATVIAEIKDGATPTILETQLLQNAKNVFAHLKPESSELLGLGSQSEMYREALEMEKKSRDFYQDKAREAVNGNQKSWFERLAEEEKKHCLLLENIIEFVSQPLTWLDNAEFSHLDSD